MNGLSWHTTVSMQQRQQLQAQIADRLKPFLPRPESVEQIAVQLENKAFRGSNSKVS